MLALAQVNLFAVGRATLRVESREALRFGLRLALDRNERGKLSAQGSARAPGNVVVEPSEVGRSSPPTPRLIHPLPAAGLVMGGRVIAPAVGPFMTAAISV